MTTDKTEPPTRIVVDDCCRCEEERLAMLKETHPLAYIQRRMILCPECGSKRCPKAADHRNACFFALQVPVPEPPTPEQRIEAAETKIRELVKAVETHGDRAAIDAVRRVMAG